MNQFEKCHGSGEAYKTFKSIEHKLTTEFNELTKELMIENYIRLEMLRPGQYDEKGFANMKRQWSFIAEELGVQFDYPYNVLHSFPHAHPFTQEAAAEGKRRLGIS